MDKLVIIYVQFVADADDDQSVPVILLAVHSQSHSEMSFAGRISQEYERQKMRLNKSNITLNIPTNLHEARENYFVRALAQTTMDFCRETTLHGIKHVVVDIQQLGSSYSRQKRISKLLSLIIWISACVMGAVFAIVLMGLIWDRFQTTPTITTVETNNYPIWNVPFPAVTICNINKVYAPATKNITEKL